MLRPLRINTTCMAARFYENEVNSKLKNKRKLSSFLDSVADAKGYKGKVSLNYIFCTDEYLLEINKSYLKHDTYTDIITFDLREKPEDITGEIYISTERIKENADKFSGSYEEELHRVIFHGLLHLCGYKDKTTEQKQRMRLEEDKCLKQYFKS